MNELLYNRMIQLYDLYRQGKVSEEDWSAYCQVALENLMVENKDVLERLKNR